MNVLILTEDSETQCPIYDKWKNRYRSGTKVENNLKILKPLFDNNLSIPKDDLENENIYLDVLSEFILQAKYMFQGSFSTIRKLEENISKYANVETLIISSRYGLIDSQKKIIPYQTTIKNKTQLLINDEKLLISDNISKKIKDFSHLIIVLPNYYLEYLLSKKILSNCNNDLKIIIIGSKKFESIYNNYSLYLYRLGVSRISTDNLNIIMEYLKKEKMDN